MRSYGMPQQRGVNIRERLAFKLGIEGDWSVARGAFFAGVLSETRSAFGPWPVPNMGDQRRELVNELELW